MLPTGLCKYFHFSLKYILKYLHTLNISCIFAHVKQLKFMAMETYRNISELENKIVKLIGRNIYVDFNSRQNTACIQIGFANGLSQIETNILKSNFENTYTDGRKYKIFNIKFISHVEGLRITKIEA